MTTVVAESKVERPERSRDTTAGSRRCPGTERQTVTADKETIGPQPSQLMEEVLRKDNLFKALKRVCANKGAPGVDGMSVNQLPRYLRKHWPTGHVQRTGTMVERGVATDARRDHQRALIGMGT